MNKFELSTKLAIAAPLKAKGQNKLLSSLVGVLTQIENSTYIGSIHQSPSKDWSDRSLLNLTALRPFVGFIAVGVDDKHGEEIETIDRGMLIHFKEIQGKWYIGIFWQVGKQWNLMGVSEVDFENYKVNYLSNSGTVTDVNESNVINLFTNFGDKFLDVITEVTCSEFVVTEYEPSNSKFKQTIPLARRERYRQYDIRVIRTSVPGHKAYPINRAKVLDAVHYLDDFLINPQAAMRFYDSLMAGVMFSGLEEKIDPTYTLRIKSDLKQLPFENFTVTHTRDFADNTQNLLLINCKRVQNGIEVSLFTSNKFKPRGEKQITLTDVYLLRDNYTHERIYMKARDLAPSIRDDHRNDSPEHLRTRLIEESKCIISDFLTAFTNYEVKKVSGRFIKNKERHMTETERIHTPVDIHLVFDMSKRRSYEIIGDGNTHRTGYHMPEHKRIGYERTSKNGVKHWVKGSTVNEGKGHLYGRVSKEYKL